MPNDVSQSPQATVHVDLYCGDEKIERLALDEGETYSAELPSDEKYHFEIVEVEE